ncbi:MAG: isoprenylcysteine carboxyl methyltransferase family protein [Deltaproteobacteria bacterium]
MSFAWVIPVIVIQRLFELRLSERHRSALLARGGREYHAETFPAMVALHVLFLASLAVESYPWRFPLDAVTWGCLAALAVVTAGRYWVIASLGEYWNVRIVVVPGAAVRRAGPYRFMRHPNYLVIVLEFLLLPLLMRAPVTLVVFSTANLFVLGERIRLEEKVLRELTDYGERFPKTR